jgi:adenosylmethionine-8-amino-7-oxononanoate aminotransferase
MERPMHEALLLLAEHPAVAEVRGGVGTMGAVELDPELLRRDAGALARVVAGAREAGVLVRPLGHSVGVSPPLTADEGHFAQITAAIAHGLDAAIGRGKPEQTAAS